MYLLISLLIYAGLAALFFYILYVIVKKAVKKGILEAHEELKKIE